MLVGNSYYLRPEMIKDIYNLDEERLKQIYDYVKENDPDYNKD